MRTLSVFVGSLGVDAVRPPLVQVDDEDEVVAQAREAMHRGHLDDEGEGLFTRRNAIMNRAFLKNQKYLDE